MIQYIYNTKSDYTTILLTELPIQVITPLTDGEVIEHQDFTFTCQLSKPNKKVTWYKDEFEITLDDSHYTVSCVDCDYTLTLHHCTLDDGAKYMVKVEDVTTSATLTVSGLYVLLLCILI